MCLLVWEAVHIRSDMAVSTQTNACNGVSFHDLLEAQKRTDSSDRQETEAESRRTYRLETEEGGTDTE